MRILIVGGNAAGTTAAQYSRLYDKKGENEVIIVEKGEIPLFSRCALPYLISGHTSVEKVIEYPEKWYERQGIELRLRTELISVDFSDKKAKLKGPEGEYELKFDRMIIATGSKSRKLFGEGRKIIYFRGLEDAKRVIELLPGTEKIAIIGAGMIGCELAEALVERGKEVKVFEYFDRVLPTVVDAEISRKVRKHMEEQGVSFSLSARVQEVKEEGKEVKVKGNFGEEPFDLVICSVGISPNVEIFERAGIKLGRTGRISVDERMETNVKGVFAAGECTEYKEKILGKEVPVGLGTIAVRQGMVAGINAAGGEERFLEGILNLRVTKLFGIEVAAVGPTGEQLSKEGINYKSSFGSFKDLPPYYGEGRPFYSKINYDEEGRVLSFQAFGRNASQKANLYYMFMYYGIRLEEIPKLETAYCPPVAPIIDPSISPIFSALRKLGKLLRCY